MAGLSDTELIRDMKQWWPGQKDFNPNNTIDSGINRTGNILRVPLPVQGRHLLDKTVAVSTLRGRLVSLLVLTSLGVSPMPFLPQDKERFGSDSSHAEKAFFFFKESPYISGA